MKEQTNFQKVKSWMQEVGQETPESFKPLSSEVLALREKLIIEEGGELIDELGWPDTDYSKVVKEAGDTLVVVYGLLAALGVDGDKAFAIVQHENDQKVAHKIIREDGKVVVPPEVKARIKAETATRIAGLTLNPE